LIGICRRSRCLGNGLACVIRHWQNWRFWMGRASNVSPDMIAGSAAPETMPDKRAISELCGATQNN
jgi:hypothetical protein